MSPRSKTQRIKAAAKTWTAFMPVPDMEQAKQANPVLAHCSGIYVNSRYQVEAFNCPCEIGGVVQLVVRRHLGIEKIPWEDLQTVKNQLFGPEYTAVEVYPPEDLSWKIGREVRILWILPSNYRPPYGLWLETAWGKTGEP